MGFIKELIKARNTGQTVFSFADLNGIVQDYSGAKLRSALKYAVKMGDLFRISRGIYAISKDYSRQEFANKYRTPSYVSLYTVLQETGVVFQPYSSIYLAANRTQEMEIDSQKYIYRKIKAEILLNPLGMVNINQVQKSVKERAVCDKLYLDGDEYFDNLREMDWELMRKLNEEVYGRNTVISSFIVKNCV